VPSSSFRHRLHYSPTLTAGHKSERVCILCWCVTMTTMMPMTRADLKLLDPQNQERNRIKQIQDMIEEIYRSVVFLATNINQHTSVPTLYRHDLTGNSKYSTAFLEANIPEILEKLRELFPDCNITHKVMIECRMGRGHPTTYTELTPNNVHLGKVSSFIIVDWS